MRFYSSEKSAARGFTLIELLVVIAIIGLLSSVILASLNGARKKSRDARRLADLKQLQTAMELYNSDNSKYPLAGAANTSQLISTLTAAGITSTYMGTIPDDPDSSKHYYWGSSGTTGADYCIGAKMETTPQPASTCNQATLLSALNTSTGGTYTVGP